MTDARTTLLDNLVRYAYQYRPEDPFVLASGATSPEYLDCRQALSHPQALRAASSLMLDSLDDKVEAVGGLTMGADPLAVGTALASATREQSLRWFSVRKTPKGHGRGRLVEGHVSKGTRVAVLDDVATTGGSTIEAIERCQEAGLHVVQVLVLVDREQGGLDAIRDRVGAGIDVRSVVKKSDIKALWNSRC